MSPTLLTLSACLEFHRFHFWIVEIDNRSVLFGSWKGFLKELPSSHLRNVLHIYFIYRLFVSSFTLFCLKSLIFGISWPLDGLVGRADHTVGLGTMSFPKVLGQLGRMCFQSLGTPAVKGRERDLLWLCRAVRSSAWFR